MDRGTSSKYEADREHSVAPPCDLADLLSGLNRSLNLVRGQLRRSETGSLARVAQLLRDHDSDLAVYLTSDEKGKLVPPFLIQLAAELKREHEMLARECDSLERAVAQLGDLLAPRQGCAGDPSAGNDGDRNAEIQPVLSGAQAATKEYGPLRKANA